MKKIFSFILAALMLVSMIPTALAAEVDVSEGTTIKVVGTGADTYTVTVPAKLAPGESGTVKANGTWPSNQTLNVTTPSSVTLTHGTQTMDVGITFDGISQVGSDTGSVSTEQTVAVASASALFGTWTGHLTYTVEMVTNSTGGDSGGESTNTYAATFADNSWADIAAACQNNEVPDTWSVGDTKTMTINGAEYDVAIIGENYDTYADGSGVAPLTFMLIEPIGTAAMNSTNTTDGGWPASEMRSMLHETVINTLEDDVKNNIKAVKKTTVAGKEDQTSNSLVYDKSEDKLFLLSDEEFSSSSTRYEYFNETHFNSSNPLYNKYWWLRSPWSNYKGMFELHSYADSLSGNSPATTTSNYMFGFCF